MKAIRIHEFGDREDVLRLEDVPVPEPGFDEVLIKVEAAALNRADLGLRHGASPLISADQLPVIPGREFAGSVQHLGSGVTEFEIGQRVVACPRLGGYAEYAVAQSSVIRPIPNDVSFAQAAALPTAFLTAWFGLLAEGQLKRGEWLLVHGGSGGVGTAAIQIGKHLGATVIATTGSEDKARRLRNLGADLAIDASRITFLPEVLRFTHNRGVDVLLEMIGGEVYQRSLQALAPGGRLFSIGAAFGPIPESTPPITGGRKVTRFSITTYLNANPEAFRQLDQILELVSKKALQVPIDTIFPLADARVAQRHLEAREHFGKVLLSP